MTGGGDDLRVTDWDAAPCGLLRIDHGLRILAANATFRSLAGLATTDGAVLSDVLTPAARILVEAQFAPMLRLNGVIDEVQVDVRRPDGTRVPVLLNARAVEDGTALFALMPVPDRHRYEQQLRQARADADAAVAVSDAVRRRLELLARANHALAGGRDVDAALTDLARVLVADTADWCLVYAVDAARPDVPTQWAAVHTDPARLDALRRFAALMPAAARPESSFRRVLAGSGALLLTGLTADALRTTTTSDEVADMMAGLDVASALVVPSSDRPRRGAVIVLGRSAARDVFTDADLSDVTDLAARTSIAIENLAMYAQQHEVAVALQQALLTSPPAVTGFDIQTRYLPGVNGNEVGGDWYDAFLQPDGTPVVVIGDVMGHDIHAAGAMGQLRGVIRTVGHASGGSPAEILATADRTARGLGVGSLATAVVGRFVRDPDGGCVVEWSNAGHPPPIVLHADGGVDVLARGNDVMLGVTADVARHDESARLAVGDTLLLYTDGLVERRDRSVDDSIDSLAGSLAALAGRELADICTAALGLRPVPSSDDVALIAIRVLPTD